jgi:hypothetical protein
MLRPSSSIPWERAVKARGLAVMGRGMVPAERTKSSTGATMLRPGDLIEKFLLAPCGSVAGAGADEVMTEELEWQPRQSQSGHASEALCVQPIGPVAETISGAGTTAEAVGAGGGMSAEAVGEGVVRCKALPKSVAKRLKAERAAEQAAKLVAECKERERRRRS